MYIWKYGSEIISIWDYVLIIIYIIILYFFLLLYRSIKKHDNIVRKYLISGITFKIAGGLFFSLFYVYYYGEGDNTNYFQSSLILLNTFNVDIFKFFSILLGNLTSENYSVFSSETGYPLYWHDRFAFSIIRISSIFSFFGFKLYLPTSFLASTFTFFGQWKVFKLLCSLYPNNTKSLAFCFLFIPSVAFWGSGLYKDSFTFMASCLLFYSFYNIFILRKRTLTQIFYILFSIYLLIQIKPYILYCELFGIFVFIIYYNLSIFKNKVIRYFLLPIITILSFLVGTYFLLRLGEKIGGHYRSIDMTLKMMKEIQKDLKNKEYYGLNSYDIGDFEPTIPGILKKFPIATITGLYRPFLWDVRKPIVFISALENTIFLLITLYSIATILKSIFYHDLSYIIKTIFNPYIIFSIIFSITLSFFIGLTAANFGALVRYKIPYIPFFYSSLFMIFNNLKLMKK